MARPFERSAWRYGNTIALAFVASSKPSPRFAYFAKHGSSCSEDNKPLNRGGSIASKAFTGGAGLHDKDVTNDADSGDWSHQLCFKPASKIVVCDFGARDRAADM
jgi:hypothetical protein